MFISIGRKQATSQTHQQGEFNIIKKMGAFTGARA